MTQPETRLFIVRHGAALGSQGIAVGQVDLPISEAGAASIERLRASWQGPPPDRLLSSDLARSKSTAEILNQSWNLDLEIDPRLREMDFGTWDGRPWNELRDTDRDRLDAWKDDWVGTAAPGGESFRDVEHRVNAWFDDLWPSLEGQTAVAVAHGGSIRTLACRILGLDLDRAFHFYLDHGRVSGVFNGLRGQELRFLNADLFPAE